MISALFHELQYVVREHNIFLYFEIRLYISGIYETNLSFRFFARTPLVGNIAKLWEVIARYICGSNMHSRCINCLSQG